MHIEPGIVDGAKILLSYGTAGACGLYALKKAAETVRDDGAAAFLTRSVLSTAAVFCFFEVFPHHPVGVSEVHLILGSTLFLLFGAAPAAFGLAAGLLVQGVFFAPFDLPQYGMNVTTLLVPLFALSALAGRIIPPKTPYTEVKYGQALALSTAYQGGVVAWVAFWAIYGHGFTAETFASVGTFGAAYMTVIIVEPLADLAVLAAAKAMRRLHDSKAFHARLYHPAV
ncbi:energy-coupling factor ABC transporter permease [Caenispirillum bisanense]|uniref:ABC-type Co2+ transport system, permease component n=1 Tax=Caenispirillum bisanense TaxID=414052 RepID=A0A286GHI5_9PROT|nr:energy-coupling factor ABC transporter permease [Caenispirillum bisanense]SOD94991.1 ABC-type Co2+ transport system, permease component [Caenispirillum bisanense]